MKTVIAVLSTLALLLVDARSNRAHCFAWLHSRLRPRACRNKQLAASPALIQ